MRPNPDPARTPAASGTVRLRVRHKAIRRDSPSHTSDLSYLLNQGTIYVHAAWLVGAFGVGRTEQPEASLHFFCVDGGAIGVPMAARGKPVRTKSRSNRHLQSLVPTRVAAQTRCILQRPDHSDIALCN